MNLKVGKNASEFVFNAFDLLEGDRYFWILLAYKWV